LAHGHRRLHHGDLPRGVLHATPVPGDQHDHQPADTLDEVHTGVSQAAIPDHGDLLL
jgi:hypothetical protein